MAIFSAQRRNYGSASDEQDVQYVVRFQLVGFSIT